MTLYADDPDVHKDYEITDTSGGTNDWTPVEVTSGETSITAAWQGDPGPTRTLRVPLTGLAPGSSHALRLVVPGGNDVDLGSVYLH